MDMIFDTATGQLTIDTADVQPWGASLRAVVKRYGQMVDMRGVQMRLTITADGAQVFDLSLPPAGVRYKQTDQDILATGRVVWTPDQQIEVSAWCRTHAGHEVTAEATFTAPPAPPLPININTADSATLQSLSGVSASRADAIIAGRPWADSADLSAISGISAAMVDGWIVDPGLIADPE